MADDKIIDFTERKNRAEQPDAEFMRRDDFGRPQYRFATEYEHDGGRWTLDLWAYDLADAEPRAMSIGKGLIVVGQLFTTTPA